MLHLLGFFFPVIYSVLPLLQPVSIVSQVVAVLLWGSVWLSLLCTFPSDS